tara:strand:- start:214 stop:576 length:363 start_codon:yes stop_codon:yes gene_type:complete
MKVRISHSIDLEEVPAKAAELLIPAEKLLEDALRWFDALREDLANDNISTEIATLSLDRIRRAMGTCDTTLEEVENIMKGVLEFEKGQNLPLPSSPPPYSEDFNKMMEEIDKEKQEIQNE